MRTKSIRMKMREEKTMDFSFGNFYIDPFSIGILGLGIIVFVGLMYRTIDPTDSSYHFFTILFSIMAIGGFAGGMALQITINKMEGKEHLINFIVIGEKLKAYKNFVFFVIGFVGLAIVQVAVSSTYSITNIEQFMFYMFAAVPEEFLYRFFIMTALFIIVYKYMNLGNPKKRLIGETLVVIISMTISILGSSYFFMASHTERYGEMPIILIGVFISSAILSFTYIMTKNILVNLLIHLLVNMLVFGSILIQV